MRYLHIVKTLWWKELLSFRLNRPLQLVLALFLVLSLVISNSAETDKNLTFYYQRGGGSAFADYFSASTRNATHRYQAPPSMEKLGRNEVILALPWEINHSDTLSSKSEISISAGSGNDEAVYSAHKLVRRHLLDFLQVPPPVTFDLRSGTRKLQESPVIRVDNLGVNLNNFAKLQTITMLCVASLMVISFNLFTMMFSEEKAKKLILAQVLSNSGESLIVAVKSTFFFIISLFAVSVIVLLYQPAIMTSVSFWFIVGLGSLAYLSLGNIIVCLAKSQTAASIFSLVYLFVVGVILLLSKDVLFFRNLSSFLFEKYLFSHLLIELSGHRIDLLTAESIIYIAVVALLSISSLLILKRRGLRS